MPQQLKRSLKSTDNFTLSWYNGGARSNVSCHLAEEGYQIVLEILTSSMEEGKKYSQMLLPLNPKGLWESGLIEDYSESTKVLDSQPFIFKQSYKFTTRLDSKFPYQMLKRVWELLWNA